MGRLTGITVCFWLLLLSLMTGCGRRAATGGADFATSPERPDHVTVAETTRPTGSREISTGEPASTGRWSERAADVQMALGNPSGATGSLRDTRNYLIRRPQYALSYNGARGQANWVSWHLSRADLGAVDRGKFQPDMSLPETFYRVTPRDYSRTGYDRGHLCPSGDRTDTEENNSATFLMTNIIPQAPGNNQGPWRLLEEYCRDLAQQGNELYIIAGGSGRKGAIARGRVTVPADTWKVIVVLPEHSGNDLARINRQTRVIAVKMPNRDGIRNRPWQAYRVSVDSLEADTGYNFLSNVPTSVQNVLESRIDRG